VGWSPREVGGPGRNFHFIPTQRYFDGKLAYLLRNTSVDDAMDLSGEEMTQNLLYGQMTSEWDVSMAAPKEKKTVRRKTFRRVDRKSLEARIETLDQEMQKAIEKGEFDVARKLAEEQEKLLEYLMLLNEKL
jgi:hypothetical protein